eukprot:SAG22_NODE_974_length_6210_cov_11.890034_3_plen_303_part_00
MQEVQQDAHFGQRHAVVGSAAVIYTCLYSSRSGMDFGANCAFMIKLAVRRTAASRMDPTCLPPALYAKLWTDVCNKIVMSAAAPRPTHSPSPSESLRTTWGLMRADLPELSRSPGGGEQGWSRKLKTPENARTVGRRSRARWTTTSSGCRLRSSQPVPPKCGAPGGFYPSLAEVGETHTSNKVSWKRPMSVEPPSEEWWMRRSSSPRRRAQTADSRGSASSRHKPTLVALRRDLVGKSMGEQGIGGTAKVGKYDSPTKRPPRLDKGNFHRQDKVGAYQEAAVQRTGKVAYGTVMAMQWPAPH